MPVDIPFEIGTAPFSSIGIPAVMLNFLDSSQVVVRGMLFAVGGK